MEKLDKNLPIAIFDKYHQYAQPLPPMLPIAMAVFNKEGANFIFSNIGCVEYVYCLKDDGTYGIAHSMHEVHRIYE